MNLDKMFSMFNVTDEEVSILGKEQATSYKDDAHFYLGLFYKMINREDSIAFTALIQSLHVDQATQTDITTVSKYLTYNHAFNYLTSINFNNQQHLVQLLVYDNLDFKAAANKAICYFIEEEEYEKCSFLKKVLDHTPLLNK